ncbi:MAG: FG-GAP-like repeat-containing protein [Planctomycetota bacterium]
MLLAGADALAQSQFTQESAARGVAYPVQPVPQTSGLYGFGVAAVDLDADGDDDIVALGRSNGQVGVFENLGNGTFANRSATSGLPPIAQASAIACADLDGDRRPELLLTQIGLPLRVFKPAAAFTFLPHALDGSLGSMAATKAVSLADIDRDGDLDIFAATYALPSGPYADARCRLWRNDGGTAVDLAPSMGLARPARSFLGVFSDLDADGDADLYVSNDRGHLAPLFEENWLFRNDDGTMVESGAGSGADVACYSMGCAAGDFDGDTRVDLLVTNIATREAPVFGVNPLMLGNGDGTFVRGEALWGVEDRATGWGALFVDFDDDGRLDLYVNHQGSANRLWRNPGVPPALLVPNAGGAAGSGSLWSYCTVHADFDRDGDQDLLVSDLGANLQLYMNAAGNAAPSARLRLEGRAPNASAIGARAEATLPDGRVLVREVHAGGVGYLGQNTLELHFGLGTAAEVAMLRVSFADGAVRTLPALPAGAHAAVHPSLLGDRDRNGDLDLLDRSALAKSIGSPVTVANAPHDIDGDMRITESDLALFDALLLARRADINRDGRVGPQDLALLLGAWGSDNASADVDLDGAVGASDLSAVLAAWN